MKNLNYRVLLRNEPEGGYTVLVPSLPGCVTYGETIKEAIEMAREAIQVYVESLREHGEDIPNDSSFSQKRFTQRHAAGNIAARMCRNTAK